MNVIVTIGNAQPLHLASWMATHFPTVGTSTVTTMGTYDGDVEQGVMLTLWDVNDATLDAVLAALGRAHPDEECFGVMEMPSSRLHYPKHNDAATAAQRKGKG